MAVVPADRQGGTPRGQDGLGGCRWRTWWAARVAAGVSLRQVAPLVTTLMVLVWGAGAAMTSMAVDGLALPDVPLLLTGLMWAGGRWWLVRHGRHAPHATRAWLDAALALSGYLLLPGPPGLIDMLPFFGLTLLIFQLPLRVGFLAALVYGTGWVVGVMVTPVGATRMAVVPLSMTIAITYLQLLLITSIDRARERLAVAHHQRLAELEAANAALRDSRAQLAQTEKLAAVGTLAAGVAHELNQPLAIIRGQAQLLLERPDLMDSVQTRLRRIERQTEKMATIIDHLRVFGAPGPTSEGEVVDVNEVTRATVHLLATQLREHGIDVCLNLGMPPPLAWANADDLKQIMLHLLTNSRDALMVTGGMVTIRSAVDHGKERVALMLLDDGPGVAETVMPRLFDPFFTTKEVGQGRGLGLSVSRGLARRWGGDLIVENRDDGHSGTRALLVLPAAVSCRERV